MVIAKPAGYHVHRPEVAGDKVPLEKIILQLLRDQVNCWLFPLHRLDVATSGVLLFAKNENAASLWSDRLRAPTTIKKYHAIVRGYTADQGVIDEPLLSDSSDQWLKAETLYKKLRQVEVPVAIGKKHNSSRYSWLEIEITTGRFHQIRRHFNRISHPVIGDSEHGDLRHNRFFREQLQIPGLCLHAQKIIFQKEGKVFECPFPPKWKKLEKFFNGEILIAK